MDVQGERLNLNMTVNSMVRQVCQVSMSAHEVSRASLEVGMEGVLGGHALFPDVQGEWKVHHQPLSSPFKMLTRTSLGFGR